MLFRSPQLIVPRPSSTEPSQLLSIPSHTSAEGAPGVQVFVDPDTHAGTVVWHAPTPQLIVPRPSSTEPSQLLSIPSHTSDMGVPAMHVFADPETHEGTVFWQAPTPQVTVPRPSSTEPLQLLSIPSHTSAVGVPATHEFATAPFTHELTPAEAHAPTPQAVGPGTKSSSTWPLQS